MKTKKDRDYSFNHTKLRLQERYNIDDLTMEQYNHMCQKILNKQNAIEIETEYQDNDTQIIYDLEFMHRNPIRVVWSEKRQCITTVLKRG